MPTILKCLLFLNSIRIDSTYLTPTWLESNRPNLMWLDYCRSPTRLESTWPDSTWLDSTKTQFDMPDPTQLDSILTCLKYKIWNQLEPIRPDFSWHKRETQHDTAPDTNRFDKTRPYSSGLDPTRIKSIESTTWHGTGGGDLHSDMSVWKMNLF